MYALYVYTEIVFAIYWQRKSQPSENLAFHGERRALLLRGKSNRMAVIDFGES
jgi:hypothetical protein